MIPEGWRPYKLGDVCSDISYGYTESASLDQIGPKFLRITDIQNYFTDWNNVPYCPISNGNHAKYKLERGDIVIARTGATTGVTTVFKDESIDAVFASYLIRYRINKRLADPFYIGYILKSTFWKSHLNSIIGGSAQPGANAKQFAAFDFLLPTLSEQSRIASVLSSLDNKIELNLQLNKTLEAIAQAIFREWFVDFRFPGFEGELVDGLPKGWRILDLGDVSTLVAGGDKPINYSIQSNEQYKIPVYSNGITNEGLQGYTDKPRINEESVTVSARGTIGYVCLRLQPYVPIVRLIAVIPNQNFLSSKYLFLWLRNQKISGTGTTQQQLTVPDFKRTKVLIPKVEIINEFTLIMNSISQKLNSNISEIETLTQLRDSLLPKLMTGKIKVA